MSRMDPTIVRSALLFAFAGLCEIGGGYLVWLWLRDGKAVWLGVIGGLVLFLYGVLLTLQPENAHFGRVYAAYGGVFVALSLLWGGGSMVCDRVASTSWAALSPWSASASSCTPLGRSADLEMRACRNRTRPSCGDCWTR